MHLTFYISIDWVLNYLKSILILFLRTRVKRVYWPDCLEIFPAAHTTYLTLLQRRKETQRYDNVFYLLNMKVEITLWRITTLSQRHHGVSMLKPGVVSTFIFNKYITLSQCRVSWCPLGYMNKKCGLEQSYIHITFNSKPSAEQNVAEISLSWLTCSNASSV